MPFVDPLPLLRLLQRIQADEEEKGQIITLVNLLGTVLMLTLPILSGILWYQFVGS